MVAQQPSMSTAMGGRRLPQQQQHYRAQYTMPVPGMQRTANGLAPNKKMNVNPRACSSASPMPTSRNGSRVPSPNAAAVGMTMEDFHAKRKVSMTNQLGVPNAKRPMHQQVVTNHPAQRAANQRVANQRVANQRVANQRVANQRVVNQRANQPPKPG